MKLEQRSGRDAQGVERRALLLPFESSG